MTTWPTGWARYNFFGCDNCNSPFRCCNTKIKTSRRFSFQSLYYFGTKFQKLEMRQDTISQFQLLFFLFLHNLFPKAKFSSFRYSSGSLIFLQKMKKLYIFQSPSRSVAFLKVHKIENFFDSDFGICVISLLVMSKY